MGVSAPHHRLVYVSRVDDAPNLPVAFMMRDILITSTILNLADDITGLLIAYKGCFAQVLEGPFAAVEACYGRIERDGRHRDPTVRLRESLPTRRFSRWSMCGQTLSETDDAVIHGAETGLNLDLWTASNSTILALLAAVADLHGDQLDRLHSQLIN